MSLLKQMDKQKRVEGIKRLNDLDPMATMRQALRRMAEERGDYSGCPMPVHGIPLVIEPTFKYAGLDGFKMTESEPVTDDGSKVRNIFWSRRLKCRVGICEDPDGTIWWAPLIGSGNSATCLLNTLGASDAWGIEQEGTAVNLLAEQLRHRQFKQYLLTGMFLETSPRSGVTYLFRKLRPTMALRGTQILCTLCMHPIGYYEHSWAGCMCPTDDVLAHLMLMRGDEKMFWRRCAQHDPSHPESGL
jgi:hypothetical protein